MSKPKIIYLSGPMRGVEDYNYPEFNRVANDLTVRGYAVLNPAANFNGAQDYDRSVYMRHDFFHVLQADYVFCLPGWKDSVGARAEVLVAQQCGIPVHEYSGGMVLAPPVVSQEVRTYIE